MTKIEYTPINFQGKSLDMILLCNEIIEEYQAEGYDLTLRQLYYQLVARDMIPNTERSYKRIGDLLSKARLAGLVSWDSIVDRTRSLSEWQTYDGPSSAILRAMSGYIIDKWDNQPYRPQVWVEKEALSGVIERPARTYEIPFFSCRGYISQSSMWRAAERLTKDIENGQIPYIIHLGDHDPSGIDMTRDIIDRLELFLFERYGYLEGQDYKINRIALNFDQVSQYNPPPNPAKMTDSRVGDYIAKYGRQSWELDALEPRVINQMIGDIILSIRDDEAWAEAESTEDAHREFLRKVYSQSREMFSNGQGE